MEEISESSCKHYRDLVYQNPDFLTYFKEATPEGELGNLNIGSRPTRRKKNGGVRQLRAIPWIFAWTQNVRHYFTLLILSLSRMYCELERCGTYVASAVESRDSFWDLHFAVESDSLRALES
jgi:hypothetical protein